MWKNLRLKSFLYLIASISILIWIVAILRLPEPVSAWDALKQIQTVVGIDSLLALVFIKWAWKWRIFQGWLVPFPSLEGTWEGVLQTTWKDPTTGLVPGPIKSILIIRQTFLWVHCTLITGESSSASYVADFLIDPDTDQKQLIFSYTNRPKAAVRHRSGFHDGTCKLEIITKPHRVLKGEYWTTRQTIGDMNLKFHSREFLEQLP